MKASTRPALNEKSASQQIDAIIKEPGDWRGKKLSQLRAVIKKADPAVVEEVKWKKPSNRAIDFYEGDTVDEAALKAFLLDAVKLNTSKSAKSKAKTAISSGDPIKVLRKW